MLSSGAVVAGGTIGCLIPPSGMFIIYGIRTETLIGALMIAGFRRRLDRPALTRAAYDTLRTPGFIFGNLVGTLVFNALVTVTTVPLNIFGWVTEMAFCRRSRPCMSRCASTRALRGGFIGSTAA